MNPGAGIAIELSALTGILLGSLLPPAGLPFALYVLAAELASTYLVHCPAHYLVGSVLGIRFRSIKIGRTTLSRALPSGLSSLSSLFAVPTLTTDKKSMASSSRSRQAAMYASGTVASTASTFVVAAVFAPSLQYWAFALSWAVALGYLLFDLVFSPKTGDLRRARAALA